MTCLENKRQQDIGSFPSLPPDILDYEDWNFPYIHKELDFNWHLFLLWWKTIDGSGAIGWIHTVVVSWQRNQHKDTAFKTTSCKIFDAWHQQSSDFFSLTLIVVAVFLLSVSLIILDDTPVDI